MDDISGRVAVGVGDRGSEALVEAVRRLDAAGVTTDGLAVMHPYLTRWVPGKTVLGTLNSKGVDAAKMLTDEMAAMGPVRLRDVDEAQALLVNLAKDLAAKGEIMLTKNRADDELVY